MVLILWASPNQEGLTADSKEHLARGIYNSGERVETIQLNKCGILSCQVCGEGWGTCRTNGTCVIRDGFQSVYEKMVEADSFAIVTPVYWHDMAEPLKAFLDRVRRCEIKFNHKLRNRKCFLVACPGGSGRGGVQCLMKMEEIMGHMEVQTVERLIVNQFNKTYMLPALEAAGGVFAKFGAR